MPNDCSVKVLVSDVKYSIWQYSITMEPVDNNQFEVVPTQKRRIAAPCPNVYLNPALDLLANDDPMCNTAMELVPNKKRKRSKSCDVIAFENTALDTGISKAAVNEFLVKELENVRKNVRYCSEPVTVGTEGNANIFDPKTEIYVPKLNTSEPKIRLSEPILEELDVDLTFSENCSEVPKDSSKNVVLEGPSEHIYANLTEIESKDKVSGTVLPEAYVMETLEPSTSDAFTVPQTIEDNDVSILQEDTNDNKYMTENRLNISDNDNITDSGISILEQKTSTTQNLEHNDISSINHTTVHTNIRNQIFVNNNSNSNLNFIDRLALDSPNLSNQSLFLDDDLNESNIMEIKTITIITKKKRIPSMKKNTNPFLDPNLKNLYDIPPPGENPFLNLNGAKIETNAEIEYNDEILNRPVQVPVPPNNPLLPRRLFDTNTSISTVNDSLVQNEYENIDNYRPESPIYENLSDVTDNNFNKQSKILGYDVSQFSAVDIMNINRNAQANCSNESTETKKVKHQFFKSLKPKRVFKKFKKTFKGDKNNSTQLNVTLNPYEIPRKLPKERSLCNEESGFENPALNLDTSDIEIEEIDDYDDDEEHQYETIKTLRNTRLNMNVTPLRERNIENMDSSQNKTNTPSKKVRFDSTLNQEKVITGNSFDYGLQSPGFDAKLEKYHDELENCINEKKFLQQM
ncbi:hypothetical protein NE865_05369 [Phthorimaea operculella]|nr:hypothetical protein NE865_05369 [Phthorimaea operculella]